MKQQCHISMIYLSWVVYLGGLAVAVSYAHWFFAAVWLISAPLLQLWYIRKFPYMSSFMGYGRIADEPASTLVPSPVKVMLYTALGCPFCPLVQERLENLQKAMSFSLEIVDVTLRPDLLASWNIRTVPVVEVHGRLLFGLVSTKDLAEAIAQPVEQMQPARR